MDFTDPSGEALPAIVVVAGAACARGAMAGALGVAAGQALEKAVSGRKPDLKDIAVGAAVGCLTGGAIRGAGALLKPAAKATGELHHAISKTVHEALENHPLLKGVYKYRDSRFATRGKDSAAHRGWQDWHRKLDKEVADWIRDNPNATREEFETYLKSVYNRPELKARFPEGF